MVEIRMEGLREGCKGKEMDGRVERRM